MRPRFIAIHGRISNIDAPIVPIRLANTAPNNRKSVFRNGATWSFCAQVNSAGDNEERADDNHECRVIDSCVEDPCQLTNKEVIETNRAGENNANLMIVPFPVMSGDQRAECDCEQQDYKRQHDEPVRRRGHDTEKTNHPAIGLTVTRSVNETRVLPGRLFRPVRCRKILMYWSTGEAARGIRWNNFANNFLRGRRSHLLEHNFSSGLSGKFFGIGVAIETRSASSVSTDRPRFLDWFNGNCWGRVWGERDWPCQKR